MLFTLIRTLISVLQSQRALAVETPALRHQLAVLQRTSKKPRIRKADRLLWVLLSRLWSRWRESLTIVQPETVIRWHREGFRLYWRWKSRGGRPGRPRVSREVRDLIRRMSESNPLWGAPHIHGEPLKLGIDVGQATVSRCLVRDREGIYWEDFVGRMKGMGIEQVPISARSPWQDPYVELIGSVRVMPKVGGLHHRYFRQAA
jgi:putative transposase